MKYKEQTIADILSMSVEKASKFFENIPSIKKKLYTLNEVGLGYVRLGQQATTYLVERHKGLNCLRNYPGPVMIEQFIFLMSQQLDYILRISGCFFLFFKS